MTTNHAANPNALIIPRETKASTTHHMAKGREAKVEEIAEGEAEATARVEEEDVDVGVETPQRMPRNSRCMWSLESSQKTLINWNLQPQT